MIHDTVREYSRHAAESFVQTAVFVDDRIYQSASTVLDEPKRAITPKARKRATKSPPEDIDDRPVAADGAEVEVDAEADDTTADTYDIVTSFAKKQIVCSLYEPKKQAKVSPASDIFPLCKAADIVILDWDLYGDKGKRAVELVDGLISQAVRDVPEQLRLILVYTQEQNLFDVADELYRKVHDTIGDDFRPVDNEGGLSFCTDNSRIAILGKPGRDRPDLPSERVVEESDLADVAITEFAKMASGLLHAAALLGLSEIRKNSRKVLSKFSSDLDPAFLTHLALCLPDDDASSHIMPLLVSEIEAVLEDALPTPLISESILKDWCQNVWRPGTHLDALLGKKEEKHKDIAEAICLRGFEEANREHTSLPKLNSDRKRLRKLSKYLLPDENSDANHQFSHLMASRTFYSEGPRSLKAGVIVRDPDNQYFLCVQPVCDSVRLEEEHVFIFIQLTELETANGNAASHVVITPGHKMLELIYEPKSYYSFAAVFKPDVATRQVVVKSVEDGAVPYFTDAGGRKYFWVDQMKTSHAQRAVENFASDLSRVGLTESEWMRRLKKKQS